MCNESKDGTSDFLSIAEAAACLGVSYGSVLAAIHSGLLVAYRFGPHRGTYRIRKDDFSDYVAACRMSTRRSPAQAKPKRTTSPFKKLDGERLLRAWREQGISADHAQDAAG